MVMNVMNVMNGALIDDYLLEVRQADFNTPEEALGALFTATTMINTAWPDVYTLEDQRQARIAEWLRDLTEVARKVARDFGASRYSITIS